MKNYKFKKSYLFELLFSVIISVTLSSLFSMYYMNHLYKLHVININTSLSINKRIDLLEQKIKDTKQATVKPVSL